MGLNATGELSLAPPKFNLMCHINDESCVFVTFTHVPSSCSIHLFHPLVPSTCSILLFYSLVRLSFLFVFKTTWYRQYFHSKLFMPLPSTVWRFFVATYKTFCRDLTTFFVATWQNFGWTWQSWIRAF